MIINEKKSAIKPHAQKLRWHSKTHFCRCDRKSRAASAQSFALWQEATIEFTYHDHSIIACSRHIYLWCCSSRTSRSWWITHLTQHHRRRCNTAQNVAPGIDALVKEKDAKFQVQVENNVIKMPSTIFQSAFHTEHLAILSLKEIGVEVALGHLSLQSVSYL